MAEAANQRPYDDDEINLLDYWRVIWKYKWLILILTVTSLLVTLIVGLFSPKIYVSTATILTPSEGGGGGGTLLSLLSSTGVAQGMAGSSIPSLTPNKDVFMSILKSRTLARKVIEALNLKDHYNSVHVESAINALRRATSISESLEGVIIIRMEDENPILAADIANAYPTYLDRFMARYGIGAATRQRRFIEEQLKKTNDSLQRAEDSMRIFQERNRTISLKDQARGAIDVGAQLKADIIASEVQLQIMRNFATEANPSVIRLKRGIEELKRQLSQIQFGAGLDLPPVGGNSGHRNKELHLPAVNFPKVSLEFGRLARDLKVQEVVYSLLTQQLEQAKIAEAKDMPVVQVLDRAVPASRKIKPKIALNMAMAGAVSFILPVLLAFFLEYIDRQRAAERPSIVNSQ